MAQGQREGHKTGPFFLRGEVALLLQGGWPQGGAPVPTLSPHPTPMKKAEVTLGRTAHPERRPPAREEPSPGRVTKAPLQALSPHRLAGVGGSVSPQKGQPRVSSAHSKRSGQKSPQLSSSQLPRRRPSTGCATAF